MENNNININQNINQKIDSNSFVTLHYRVEQINSLNSEVQEPQEIVNTFTGTPVTLALGQGQLSPLLEEKLIGLSENDVYPKTFHIENAFGQHDMQLVRAFALSDLQNYGIEANLVAGDLVRFNFEHLPQQKISSDISEGGLKNLPPFVGASFIKYEGDFAFFDFNHPLAGQSLIFTVQVLSVL